MRLLAAAIEGLTWRRIGLVVLLNTGIVALIAPFFENTFWDLLISGQCLGLSIMFSVNAANNWRRPGMPRPLALALAIVGGSLFGTLLTWLIKGRSLDLIVESPHIFLTNIVLGILLGGGFGYAFFVREREARARAHHEAQQNLLSKQVLEAQLKLMQAQIEPHFLYNTLANVQALIETEPATAARMIDNLIRYLRAAVPQMRESNTTLGRDIEMVRAYLAIIAIRMGPRLDYRIDLPTPLASARFPPMMLLSLVENAIKHGLEPMKAGGTLHIRAEQVEARVSVTVADDGRGFPDQPGARQGVGLANIRERLASLYGEAGRLVLEENSPSGVRATIEVPYQDATRNHR